MHEGKTPIARCADKGKYDTLAEIDKPNVTVITNPGGTNERFDQAHLKSAKMMVFKDNTKIFDVIAQGKVDLMITDASETRYQAKPHKGVLCSTHPGKPFNFGAKGFWIQRDPYLKDFVDQWLHQSMHDGAYTAIYDTWFG